jgi:hypothetical protein
LHRGGEDGRAGWQARVGADRRRRAVVEQEHQMRQQRVTARQVDDSSTAEPPACPTRDLPRLEELLARQTVGATHGASDTMKQRAVGKAR